MIIVRQVFFLCDPDRNKDRLSHCISLECNVDGKHLRHCLNYCFVDRIRDAISNRVTMDNSICFLDKIDLCPLCTSAGQKTEKTKNQNLYYMPSFHD